MEIISGEELANYLGASVAADGDRLDLIVELANGLVSEKWANPTDADKVPTWVRAIAFEVAARPLRNPGGLASVTRHVDDASRTERLSDAAARAGLFLTTEEEARLANSGRTRRGHGYGTIRLQVG